MLKINNEKELDNVQLINYVNFGVVPSPNTLFKNVYKLEPNSVVEKVDFSKDKLEKKLIITGKLKTI